MFRKTYFTFLLTALFIAAGSTAAFAQTQPLSGKVVMKKADGTTVPVADALVEGYRTDIKGKLSPDKTNKKGEFNFVGLQPGAVYVLSVSAAGAAPAYLPNIRAGETTLVITVSEGDGKRWTEDEVRLALSGTSPSSGTAAPPQSSADQKKAAEERAKLEAEYAAKVKDAENQNATIKKLLEEGNAAYTAKDYDLAVAKYSEGVNVAPDFIGSAPILNNNKAASLTNRGIGYRNKGVQSTDTAAKIENYNKARADFSEALAAYERAWTLLKNAPASEIKDAQNHQANKLSTLNGFANLLRVMNQAEQVPADKLSTVETLYAEFDAMETDAAKKAEAQYSLAGVYALAGDLPKAIDGYKKALANSPNNPDILANLGLYLVSSGYNQDNTVNTAVMQEAINYLQKFLDVAPNNHKLKTGVLESMATLKALNLKPEKTNTKRKN